VSVRSLALRAALAAALLWPSVATADDLEALRAQALNLVNRSRAAQGLPPLVPDAATQAAAQRHADDMRARHYYAHVSPEGLTHHDRYVAAGGARWRLVAENIFRCPDCGASAAAVQQLHQGWMGSAAHRDNILARGMNSFGYGLAAGRGGVTAVQLFAGPGTPAGLDREESTDAVQPETQARIAAERINRLRRDAGRPALSLDPALTEAGRVAIPDPRSGRFDLEQIGQGALASVRGGWRSLHLLSGSCGGCGALATSADIGNFIEGWRADPRTGGVLTGAEATHIGFSMAVDGSGRKLAVAILASSR
jgi:uncharacterized protein YkwD